MDDFYAARDNTMPPLPWTNFAPPHTIVLDLKKNEPNSTIALSGKALGGSNALVPVLSNEFERVIIHAEDWGQIAVYPGGWYDSSLLELGKPYVANPKTFFGKKGILRGRVSNFIVGYKLTFEFHSPKTVASEAKKNLSKFRALKAFGVPVKMDEEAQDESKLVLASDAIVPSIVAVTLGR